VSLYRKAIRDVRSLLNTVQKRRLPEPTAMTLATASSDGQPSVRTVLLKEVTEKGFVFFTNEESRKGRQLRANPKAALCFFWESLNRQVIVEGRAVKVDAKEADAYWKTRPRESQLGAWASMQSRPLKNRAELEKRLAGLRARFRGQNVPRPPYWLGFRVIPNRIEFWKRGLYRLHHRLVYVKAGGRWKTVLLNP
jgi:pyridoxamine 5'-phosphate oxidase